MILSMKLGFCITQTIVVMCSNTDTGNGNKKIPSNGDIVNVKGVFFPCTLCVTIF